MDELGAEQFICEQLVFSIMPAESDLGRAFCIITGASRGFGRIVARELSRVVKPGSAFLLVARSGDDLRSLQAELTELAETEAPRGGLLVQCVEADLGQAEGLQRITRAAQDAATELTQHVLLVNNAGLSVNFINHKLQHVAAEMGGNENGHPRSPPLPARNTRKVERPTPLKELGSRAQDVCGGSLGDISRFTASFTDMAEVNSYLSLNVSSFLCLTAQILQAFPQRPGLRRTVINISSLCALQPFSSWVLYCSGKAARDMMFRVLATEEPDLRVLNYAPGPLDTDMQLQARTKSGDAQLRKSFSEMFSEGRLLSCEESCAKLVKLLLENSYTSGAHIDFYDF